MHIRSLLILALTVLGVTRVAAPAQAQIQLTEIELDRPYDDQVQLIEMTVSPAAEPSPVFRHRLTYLPPELQTGNAALIYFQLMTEGKLKRKWKELRQEFGEEVETWGSLQSSQDNQSDKIRQAAKQLNKSIGRHIDRASRRRDCDWGYNIQQLSGAEAFQWNLVGLPETRSISRAIALQTKSAILESRFDDAVKLMRMNYRLAENVGGLPLLVGDLISLALSNMTNDNMIEFIASPDSPNMYWALTEMPRPLFSLRDSIRFEHLSWSRFFPEIETADTAVRSLEEWRDVAQRVADKFDKLVRSLNLDPAPTEFDSLTKLLPTLLGIVGYSAAKNRLAAHGLDSAKIENMPVAQVLLVDAKQQCQLFSNLLEKEIYLPYPESRQRILSIEEELFGDPTKSVDNLGLFTSLNLLPAIAQVHRAYMRGQRDTEALRLIEALRMHAAVTGSLPKTLDEITVVPAPNNPATGKPFQYQLVEGTAIIDLPNGEGFTFSKRFKLTLRK